MVYYKLKTFKYMKLREIEESREKQRKENLDLRRNMNDEVHEKDTVSKANEQLRAQIRKTEKEKISLKVSRF